MMNEEHKIQDASENYLEGADINDDVVTLGQLLQRRQKLLKQKEYILQNMKSGPSLNELIPVQPVYAGVQEDLVSTATFTTRYDLEATTNGITVLAPVLDSVTIIPTVDSNVGDSLANETKADFESDYSVADPSYVPLSEITNVQPLDSFDVDWFPEREIEPQVASASRTRKRKADRTHWKKNKNQVNRMLGKEYTGFKKIDNKYVQNEPKPKRVLGPKCNSPLCQGSKTLYCAAITEEMRQKIFQSFWSMSWKEKKIFVSTMVDKQAPQRQKTDNESRRLFTKKYHLQINGILNRRVCLKTFLSTLGIKEWTMRYWLGDKNVRQQLNPEHSNDSLNNETKRRTVKKYLSSLPKLPSHYCRQSTTKQYLEPNIQSKSVLYRMYVEFTASKSGPTASRKLFNDVFEEENIGLYQPKKDACDFCCSYKAGNVEEEAYQQHIEAKNIAREEKNRDKQKAKLKTIHAITADLQAVKLCPSLNASALYFKTKLAVHNFTIYDLGTDQVCCYWFDETSCDLKATSYASFFADYLTKLLERDPKDVVIWSDGCTAQNRNSVLANTLLMLAKEKNVSITQKYLEKGHTQMEVDSVHSVIERKLKNTEIFLPSQYITITKEARKRPFPYTVIHTDYTFFKDYSDKRYQIYDSIRPGRGVGDGCVVNLRVLKYNPHGSIEYKTDFKADFSPLPRRPKIVSLPLSSIPLLYSSRLPIQATKYEHLQQLKSVIPRDCHAYYDNLPFNRR